MGIKSIILGIMAIGLGFIIFEQQMVVQAEDISVPKASAPQGIAVGSYFKRGTTTGNSANVVDTNKGDQQAVLLTTGPKQLGTIWTKDIAKMNMGEDQTASMWMYFGSGYSKGDGMAFVIQNGDYNASAIDNSDKATPVAAKGETLGVWGLDANNQYKSSKELAATAIQDSWALEFDTFDNRLPDGRQAPDSDQNWNSYFLNPVSHANQFDLNMPSGYPHIASNYPGDPNTYKIVTKNLNWSVTQHHGGSLWGWDTSEPRSATYNYATMVHQQPITNDFLLLWNRDGKWKHLTLDWRAPSAGSTEGQMTYTFNDKDPDTGEKIAEAPSRTVPIDISKLRLGADKRVRWGFTGSTGALYENNLVVFEKVPGLVDVDAKAQLVDKSQANKVIDDPKARVYTGDRMVLKYHLNYKSGRDSWQKIQSKLHLPAGIAFNSATVTYDDGKLAADKGTETFGINPDDISGQSVSGILARSLSKNTTVGETAGATITFTGYATSKIATASSPEEIASQTSSFEGTNAITQATTSAFQLVAGEDDTSVMTMSLTGDHVLPGSDNLRGSESLDSAADVTVSGRIDYRKKSDGTAITGKTLTLQPRFNGESLQTKVITDTEKRGIYDFTYTIPAGNLLGGGHDNILELFAADTSAHLSATNSLRYTVMLRGGTRTMSVSSFATFNKDNPQHMTGRRMRLKPDSNWSVTVHDSVGKNDAWTLQASASPLTSRLRDGLLAGDLKYVDGEGNENSLTQGSVNLEHHVTASDDEDFDITKLWRDKPNRGIFLDIDGGAAQGQYMSQVSWTLIQDPITQES